MSSLFMNSEFPVGCNLLNLSQTTSSGTIPVDKKDASIEKPQEERLTMDPADIRVIRRLSERVNVLPIIARADVLTDEKLTAARKAVRRDLHEAKINFGIFGPIKVDEETSEMSTNGSTDRDAGSIESNKRGSQSDEGIGAEESDDDVPLASSAPAENDNAGAADERRARPVVKLNPAHRAPARSTSRSRLALSDRGSESEDKRAPISLADLASDAAGAGETLAAIRFSAGWLASNAPREIAEAMPFAVVMPEAPVGGSLRVRSRALKPPVVAPLRPVSAYSVDSTRGGSVYARSPGAQSEPDTHIAYLPSSAGSAVDGEAVNGAGEKDEDRGTPTPTASVRHAPSMDHLPQTPTHAHPHLHHEPRDLRGVFVRRFRWGCVDVLNPEHCDFAALRTAVLSTHFKVLKLNTKEVLYEKYRTEKLLARRATRNISDEDRKRLLESKFYLF